MILKSDQKRLQDLLEIEFPLIQSGMGGIATPSLALGVLSEGCAGVVALYKNSPHQIGEDLTLMRSRTGARFGVNLIPEIVEEGYLLQQIQAVLDFPGVYFTFYGLPSPDAARAVTSSESIMVIMVGTAEEAIRARELGASIIALQGVEAGGHLLGNLSSEELLQKITPLDLKLPLLVSGGAGTGKDLARFVSLGAAGALSGTMFVPALESNAHDLYKERIRETKSDDTVITYRFDVGWPGRKHRVIRSHLTDSEEILQKSFIARIKVGSELYAIPRYSSVVPTRQTKGKIEEMVMYCGSSCDFINEIRPVASILSEYKTEYNSHIE